MTGDRTTEDLIGALHEALDLLQAQAPDSAAIPILSDFIAQFREHGQEKRTQAREAADALRQSGGARDALDALK